MFVLLLSSRLLFKKKLGFGVPSCVALLSGTGIWSFNPSCALANEFIQHVVSSVGFANFAIRFSAF